MTFDPWTGIRDNQARDRQVSENSARLAQAFGFFTTQGWGEFTFDKCYSFGLTFLEEPAIAYGYAIDGDALVDLRFPRSWGFVYRWRTDSRGYYTGAWVGIVVDTRSAADIAGVPTDEPNYSLDHTFTFTGVALKDLPTDLLND